MYPPPPCCKILVLMGKHVQDLEHAGVTGKFVLNKSLDGISFGTD